MKARTMSRNAWCSSVKISRRIAIDLPWHGNPVPDGRFPVFGAEERQPVLRLHWAHANKRPTGGRRRGDRPLASSGRRVVLLAAPPASRRALLAPRPPFGGCSVGSSPR